MDLKVDLIIESGKIQNTRKKIQKLLERLPEGEFSCRTSNHRDKWFQVKDETGEHQTGKRKRKVFIYIPKSDEELARKLAYKMYLLYKACDLNEEEKAIQAFQSRLDYRCGKADTYLANPGISRLISPILEKKDKVRIEWQEESYPRNTEHPENLTIPTIGGFNVRSKSEALIANLLIERKIPFRYECAYAFGRRIYYPDFTIRSPLNDQIVIWEHFGMFDVQTYQAEYWSKMSKYISDGFLPYYNLITTFETKESPLDISAADRIIRMMFEN